MIFEYLIFYIIEMPSADETEIGGELLMFTAVTAAAIASGTKLERNCSDVFRFLRGGAKAVIAGTEDRPKYTIARDFFALSDDPGAQPMAGEARRLRQAKRV